MLPLPVKPAAPRCPGFTLLELSVVVSVLLALASLLATGARAWKRGTDRANCLITMRNTQQAVRCYQNLQGFTPDMDLPGNQGAADIPSALLARGYFTQHQYDQATGAATCPGGGTFTCAAPNHFPALGTPFVTCSLSADPDDHQGEWPPDW
jgi:prepilin-type N-terminal cleavage/methylation domain-containing protein